MIDLLRRHAALVVALVFVWLGWSDLNPDAGKKKAEAKIERLEIGASCLRIREPDERLPALVDPYRLAKDAAHEEAIRAAKAAATQGRKPADASAGPSGPGAALATSGRSSPDTAVPHAATQPADPLETAAAWLAAARMLGRDVLAFGRHLLDGPGWSPGAPAGKAPKPSPSFVLHLEATLSLPDGGQARICGQTVQVGESLQGLDPEEPPCLLSVRGTEAVVAHGDDLYVLDLVSRPVVTVGEPARAVADAARVQAGGAVDQPPPRAAAPKPAASSAAAGAPAGGTKVKVPHVRKFPQKKKP
ncbi:MAG TPA: hypothetical protein VFY71_14005 [Planctomycetota bacterium]|nr:hypothetical protein [Planctomycetota bacterium]